jgi:two-component system LytT family sensor kinase
MKKSLPLSCKPNIAQTEIFNFKYWLKITVYAILVGLGIGIILCILISVLNGKWIGTERAIFQLLFSCVIGFFVSNSIHFSKRLWAGKGSHIFYISLYYLFSLSGAFIAIELLYYTFSGLFKTKYTFFHKSDFLFASIITLIVSTVSYIYFSQKARFSTQIKEKEMDLLRLKQMKTQAELATLQSKINPHFLYNSLNAIASLIHFNPDKAESMTLKLSKLFRYSINQGGENLISIQEEVDILQTYLDIEKVRFGDRINFIIDIDKTISHEKIPRFLIQPLVENALKHGLKDTIEKGELKVSIKKTKNIDIVVSDNGHPFPNELEIGYGLQSTYDKLELLYPGNYELQITNEPFKQIKIQIQLHDK